MSLTTLKVFFLESPHFASVRGNTRLQWMLVFILILLFVYVGKLSFDGLKSGHTEVNRQAQLYARLQNTLEADIDDASLAEWQNIYENTLEEIPKASSQSIAEASALAKLENSLSALLTRSRLNLLGSEEAVVAQNTFYSVRVELSGRLTSDKLSEFLSLVAQNRSHIVLQTLNYSPRTSNTLTLVVDVLFVQPQAVTGKNARLEEE